MRAAENLGRFTTESAVTEVLLVGAGQLGSRYLQGLRAVSEPLRIVVIDPSIKSLARAATRWNQALPGARHPEPLFATSVREVSVKLTNRVDVAIVSTDAASRPCAVTTAAEELQPRCWVIEKILAQSKNEVRAVEAAVGQDGVAFVNTPRRMMRGYWALKKRLKPPLAVTVVGGRWGLASNAIHFLDAVAWLSDSVVTGVTVDQHSGTWYSLQRIGHYDLTGRLEADFAEGSHLVLDARSFDSPLILTVTDSSGAQWSVDQSAGVARSGGGETMQVDFELQSAMTPRLVSQLLATGSCDLPTLKESARVHEPLLDALLKHWNAATGRSDTRVPIT